MNILCIFYILYILIFGRPPLRPPSNFQHLLFPFPGKIQGFKLPNAKLIFLENKKFPSKLLFLSTRLPPYSPVHEMYESEEEGEGRRRAGGEVPANSSDFAFLPLRCWRTKGNPYFGAKITCSCSY